MMRSRLAVIAALLSCAAPAAAQARDPVLFVHGWDGDRAQWRLMMARFRADGWTDRELFAWTIDPRGSNLSNAARVAARVDQILAATGAERVDIVTHSMGGLSARLYLKDPGSRGKVDAWVSLGGPNHGTSTAWLCFSAACREMRPDSPLLRTLNAGDETPGEARYATWRSPCDELIDPVTTVALEGAENHESGCLSHLGLLRDSAVYRQVRDFIRQDHPGTAARAGAASRARRSAAYAPITVITPASTAPSTATRFPAKAIQLTSESPGDTPRSPEAAWTSTVVMKP